MYTRTILLLLLASLFTAMPATTDGAGRNEWYLYGNRVLPEEPKLETRNGRTVVTVNGIQVIPALQKARKEAPQVSDTTRAQVELADRAEALKNQLLQAGEDQDTILFRLAELFKASSLVKAVELSDPTVVKVRWAGESGWEYMMYSFEPPPDPDAIYQQRVENEYLFMHEAWELDCLVVLSTGTYYLFNPRNPDTTLDQVRAEIQRAKETSDEDLQDGAWQGRYVRNANMARELKQPRPMEQLREG